MIIEVHPHGRTPSARAKLAATSYRRRVARASN